MNMNGRVNIQNWQLYKVGCQSSIHNHQLERRRERERERERERQGERGRERDGGTEGVKEREGQKL